MEYNVTVPDYYQNNHDIEIRQSSLFLQEMIGSDEIKIILNNDSILKKYRKELYDDSVIISLSNTEYMKYECKPWLLCYDRYQTPELWAELLNLNQMSSIFEFTRREIRVFDYSILSKLVNILDLEREVIGINYEEILEQKKQAAQE